MANVIFVKLHSAPLEHFFKDQIVKLDARQIQVATSFGMDLSRPFGRSYSFLVWARDCCNCEWPRLPNTFGGHGMSWLAEPQNGLSNPSIIENEASICLTVPLCTLAPSFERCQPSIHIFFASIS